MPRDASLSDSKCWNGGHEWVKSKQRAFRVHFIILWKDLINSSSSIQFIEGYGPFGHMNQNFYVNVCIITFRFVLSKKKILFNLAFLC